MDLCHSTSCHTPLISCHTLPSTMLEEDIPRENKRKQSSTEPCFTSLPCLLKINDPFFFTLGLHPRVRTRTSMAQICRRIGHCFAQGWPIGPSCSAGFESRSLALGRESESRRDSRPLMGQVFAASGPFMCFSGRTLLKHVYSESSKPETPRTASNMSKTMSNIIYIVM